MKLAVLFFTIFFFNLSYANFPYLGDGSDNCDFNNSVLNKSLYNCTTLLVQGNVTVDSSVTTPVIIRVIGEASIYGTLDFSGTTGIDGISGITNEFTTVAGRAGGHQTASGPKVLSAGEFGAHAIAIGATEACGGGGGGGAAHNSQFGPTSGSPTSLCSIGIIQQSSPGAKGITSYGDESYFEFEFEGGAGGGNGSNGSEEGNVGEGGIGGAGGGALRIIAGGVIEIHPSGKILIDGGDGGNGIDPLPANGLDGGGGGGGGGAGGSLFLQSKLDVINNGIISATGGIGGTGIANGGNGGNGAKGRIRIDDLDGNIDGSGTVDPSPYTRSIFEGKNFSGTLSCGTIKENGEDTTAFLSLILGLLFVVGIKKMAFLRRPLANEK